MKNLFSLLAISLLSMSVQAGRPMNVDDANVNEKGVAHSQTLQANMQVTAAQDQGCYFA